MPVDYLGVIDRHTICPVNTRGMRPNELDAAVGVWL
jgi:hypothetical protein